MIAITLGVKRQLAAAYTCSLGCLVGGCLMGWPAPTLKKLREWDSRIHLTVYEEMWVINALYITTIIGPFPCGALMNKIGRKKSLLVLSVFPITSWILVYFSTNALMLVTARALAGIWTGTLQTVIPIYVAEISEPHLRGVAGTFFMMNGFLGVLFVFVVGPYVSFQLMAVIGGMLPLLFFVLFSFCPESPYFYVMKKKQQLAADSLSWFRGDAPIDKELQTIQHAIEIESQDDTSYFKTMLNLITVPANRKAFIIVEVINFLQRFSGVSCMMAYSSVILPDHIGPLTPDHCTLIMGIVWMLSSILCAFLIDRLGRKPLLYVSSVGIIISMLVTSVWYYLDTATSLQIGTFNSTPFIGFLVYGFAFSVGIGPISATYQGELFPSNLKGQASALTAMNTAASSAISTAVFAVLTSYGWLYVNFLIFAAVGFVNLIFTYSYVIETKGKSLQTIQDELQNRNKDAPITKAEKFENTAG